MLVKKVFQIFWKNTREASEVELKVYQKWTWSFFITLIKKINEQFYIRGWVNALR